MQIGVDEDENRGSSAPIAQPANIVDGAWGPRAVFTWACVPFFVARVTSLCKGQEQYRVLVGIGPLISSLSLERDGLCIVSHPLPAHEQTDSASFRTTSICPPLRKRCCEHASFSTHCFSVCTHTIMCQVDEQLLGHLPRTNALFSRHHLVVPSRSQILDLQCKVDWSNLAVAGVVRLAELEEK
jgi:hypothetical protein